MKRNFSSFFIRSGLTLGLALALAACGREEPAEEDEFVEIECGPGTTLVDLTCVLADFDCPDGQVATPIGQCAPPSVFCGTGTAYDAAADGCVSTSTVSCGPGTIEVDRRCLVEDPLRCGSGTVLADGECRLRDNVCGPGTTLDELSCSPIGTACAPGTQFDVAHQECVDLGVVSCGEQTVASGNQCVPLATFADQLATESDVDSADATRLIALSDEIGDKVIFTGTMRNQNNLFHVFDLQASAGTWIKITIYSRGVPSPGFRLRQVFGSWERHATPGYQSVPSRTVLIPATENYNLIVESTLSMAPGGPYGGPDWKYVGVAEVVEAPSAQPWTLFDEALTGNLQNTTNNFVPVQFPSDSHTLLIPSNLGPSADRPVLELWTSPTQRSATFTLEDNVAISINGNNFPGTTYMLIDARSFHGHLTGFTLNADETVNLQPGAVQSRDFYAEEGQVLYLMHRNANGTAMQARIFFNDEEVYFHDNLRAVNQSTAFAADTTYRRFFYIPEDGVYTVEYENHTSSTINAFYNSSYVGEVRTATGDSAETVNYQTSFTTTLSDERGNWRLVLLDVPQTTLLSGTASINAGNFNISVYDTSTYERIYNNTTTGTSKSFNTTLWTEGQYFLVFRPVNTTFSGTLNVSLELSPQDALAPGESYTQTFTASTLDVLRGSLSYDVGGPPTLRVLNPNGTEVFRNENVGTSHNFYGVIPGNGEFTLEVVNNSDLPILGLDVDFETVTPEHFVSLSGDPVEASVTGGAMLEGDVERLLFRSGTGLNLQTLLSIGESEQARVRITNLATGSVSTATGTGSVAVNNPNFNAGHFLVEITALSDLETGYTFDLDGAVLYFFYNHILFNPALNIPNDGDLTTGIVTTSMTVSGCPSVSSVSTGLWWDSGLKNWMIWELISPSGTVVVLNNEDTGTANRAQGWVYPSPDTPAESMNAFSGESGNGVWTLRIANRTISTITYLREWDLHIVCN